MHKGRLEAFSDGVIAIILTIMVIDLKAPKEPTLEALSHLWPVWLAYALSYYNIFVLWVSHHDVFSHVHEIDRGVLSANGLFLFCMSLIPFATAFAGEEHWSSPLPVVLYGLVMLAATLTFGRLRLKISTVSSEPAGSVQLHSDVRRSYRLAFFFLAGSASALVYPRLGLLLFVAAPIALRLARGIKPDSSG